MLLDLKKDLEEREQRGLCKKKAHFLGPGVQDEYFNNLAALAELVPIQPVITKIFEKDVSNYIQSSSTFRDFAFKILNDETFEMTSIKRNDS